MEKRCKFCDKGFSKPSRYSKVQWGKSIFRSNRCHQEYRAIGKRDIIECVVCEKSISKTKSQIDHGAKTCSFNCKNKYLSFLVRGKGNPFYGKKHSNETKEYISRLKIGVPNGKIAGKNCHFWKGGISEQNRTFRQNVMRSLRYKNWRRSIFERDNYLCVLCGAGGALQADHIKPFIKYPKLRFDLKNGRTLCVSCHRKTETYSRKRN